MPVSEQCGILLLHGDTMATWRAHKKRQAPHGEGPSPMARHGRIHTRHGRIHNSTCARMRSHALACACALVRAPADKVCRVDHYEYIDPHVMRRQVGESIHAEEFGQTVLVRPYVERAVVHEENGSAGAVPAVGVGPARACVDGEHWNGYTGAVVQEGAVVYRCRGACARVCACACVLPRGARGRIRRRRERERLDMHART